MSPALRTAVLALLVFLLAAPLAACGKKGPLEPPDDKERTYPRTYPTR